MSGYVYVCEDEENREAGVELPVEEDGNLLVSVLQSQFERASGLKYRNPTSGCWRAIKRVDDVLRPPEGGWGETVYVVVLMPPTSSNPTLLSGAVVETETGEEGEVAVVEVQTEETLSVGGGGGASDGNYNKRKMEDEGEGEGERSAKNPRSTSPDFTSLKVSDMNREDMIILGLQWSITDQELRRYFEQYGEVAVAEVKKHHDTGKSRGFGFVRFFDPVVQGKVQVMQHTIKGRRVDIKHPRKSPSYMPCKLFVGCLPTKPEATMDELREYFCKYGEISDVYIPKPYRGFGFVTFQEGSDAQKVLSQTHRLRHSTLNITHADPKGSVRQTTPAQNTGTSNYGYGFGSQFYNPQTQGTPQVYYAYGTPQQPAQYNFARGFSPQQQAGYVPGPPAAGRPSQQQSHAEQYQQQGNDVPPPAKRPHAGGQEVHAAGEQYYGGHYAGEYGGNGARYRGGGWPQ